MIIYQALPRLFGNSVADPVPGGSRERNGCGRMADFTRRALEEIRDLGATHVWYTGLLEHATRTDYSAHGIRPDHPAVVKGRAGSPYAVKDYFDIDPDLARDVENRMGEFRNLLARTRRAGLRAVIDFVPNHVARQYRSDRCPEGARDLGQGDNTAAAFSPGNNFYYLPGQELRLDRVAPGATYREKPARATGNDVFSARPGPGDWYETVKLNYGVDIAGGGARHFDPRPATWGQMLRVLLYWAAQGVDAFRCDMAEMVPVEFWEWAIPRVKAERPSVEFIAEVYNPALYRDYLRRGHFDYLYDKVGLYDTLRAVTRGERSAQDITRCWQDVDDIRGHMLNFLENHDEQRLASDFFAGNALMGRAPLLVSALMRESPVMVYFGQELGERGMDREGFSGRDGRTTIFDYWSVDTVRRWRDGGRFTGRLLSDGEKALRAYYRAVLRAKRDEPALARGGFFDLMYVNPQLQRQYAFARRAGGQAVVVVANFAPEYTAVSLTLPEALFSVLGLEERRRLPVTDLLTGRRSEVSLRPGEPLRTLVPAWGGVVLSARM